MQLKNVSDETVTFVINKAYLFLLAGLLFGFLGGYALAWRVFGATQGQAAAIPDTAGSANADPAGAAVVAPAVMPEFDVEGRPFAGSENATVTVVEFTDYQCPFCQRHATQTLAQILEANGDQIRYVVLNLPLTNIHPFAQKAAEAAECAHDQGKFWEYHDLLFANQTALAEADLKAYASELGLDTAAFNTCLDSGAKAEIVAQDAAAAARAGVTGTPTFFVNGQKLVGAVQPATLQALIDQSLGN